MLLGLTLGDALGTGPTEPSVSGPLAAGVTTQLTAFTVEGLIRASVRFAHKGICHPPTVVWHACCRWAYLQGIEPNLMRERWAWDSPQGWPDGWLASVPALSQRRGSAPATVAALKSPAPGTSEHATTTSAGYHAVTRTLPSAVLISRKGMGFGDDFARELTAQTHGAAEAHETAAVAAVLASHLLGGGPLERVPDLIRQTSRSSEVAVEASRAWDLGTKKPGSSSVLANLAPRATALSALVGGLYVVASFPESRSVDRALAFALKSPRRASVAPVAGALLGARDGADALPVEMVSR